LISVRAAVAFIAAVTVRFDGFGGVPNSDALEAVAFNACRMRPIADRALTILTVAVDLLVASYAAALLLTIAPAMAADPPPLSHYHLP